MIMNEMILVLLLKLSDGSLALVVGDAAGSAEWLVSQPQNYALCYCRFVRPEYWIPLSQRGKIPGS